MPWLASALVTAGLKRDAGHCARSRCRLQTPGPWCGNPCLPRLQPAMLTATVVLESVRSPGGFLHPLQREGHLQARF